MKALHEFESLLRQQWISWYSSKGEGCPKSRLDSMKQRNIGGFLAVFNSDLIEKKRAENLNLFAADSSSSSTAHSSIKVFKDFDESQFNFNKCSEKEVLFYVNFDDESVMTKEQNAMQDDENLEENNCDRSISEFINHPIIANASPTCRFHALLPIFPEQCLPQVIGQDLLQLVLSTFKLSGSPHLRIGFNSIGGYASVNHLHFQLVYADEFFPEQKVFPIETAKTKLLLRSGLQTKDSDQINMYSVGVRIEELMDYPVKGLVFRSDAETEEESELDQAEIHSSLAFAVGLYTNILLEEQVPHNVFISNSGKRIFVVPRKDQHEESGYQDDCRPAFLEIAGVLFCRNPAFYENLNAEKVHNFLAKYVSLQDKLYVHTVSQLKNQFQELFF